MRKINEIFYSLQGEGHHTGYPSVFIRFSGCNLQCPFCDTRHNDGVGMTDTDIIQAVKLYKADWVVLTGGEPSMWIDAEFIRLLHQATGK
ncbi:MAG: 7-carboxy-7-deazaguanine synthase QueE, partial [Muribaculaceae bacterium]|nr:7-carboxy-7-deazaguanine synthase QueE [Muribaculaceae bacterium]